MRKEEIIEKVANKNAITKKAAKEIVESVFEEIIEGCKNDGAVDVYGFGKFEKQFKQAGRRTIAGKEFDVESKNSLKFKPAKAFKDRMN